MENVIKTYLRDGKNNPFGVVVATKDPSTGVVSFGYSLCSPAEPFNKKRGTAIAINRAQHDDVRGKAAGLVPRVPDRRELIASAYESLEARIKRYFKENV